MASVRDRLLIEKSNVPYRFTIALPRKIYDIEVRYNEYSDTFNMHLYSDNELLCIEPIIYGRALFEQVYQPEIYPAMRIVPNDSSESARRVTWDNFGESVFLEVYNMEGD